VKGILLPGGAGTRLAPITLGISKQLLPIYDKPTIYYPLSVLLLAKIRDVLVISTPRDLPLIESLLGDGSRFGITLTYRVQSEPRGIAEALVIGEDFLAGEPVCLILGDNIFYGHNLVQHLGEATALTEGARIFAYNVSDPERYGVVTLDRDGRPRELEEKPARPKSHWAVTGIYFYDGRAAGFARDLRPSKRGEIEITELNRRYLELGQLSVTQLKRGFAWLDTGTFDSLLSSSIYVQTLEKRQGLKIACLEEIAFKLGFIDTAQLTRAIEAHRNSEYGRYLAQVLSEGR
jgi:glucose-1-phosphate thymidylyltransferase